jgi:protoporphyrin/coproporphyrin ferrochelatase
VKNLMSEKTGVLVVNLGTPKSPAPSDVGSYLREFLMDPLVIDIPWPLRWILVNVLIVPRRKVASGKLYENVWTADGSPLLTYSRDAVNALGKVLEWPVWLGMRYGEPSLSSVIESIFQAGVRRLLVFPQYPQYSLAASESSIQRVREILKSPRYSGMEVEFIPAFFDDEAYLDAVAAVSRPHLDRFQPDKVLFSFHGIPERQVKKTDPSGRHCLQSKNCCEVLVPQNRNCYRAQCFWTAKWVAKRLGLKDYVVGFQSRLSGTPWIQPYSDMYYEELPKKGVKRLAVISPSFVADCLETLEEVGIRAVEQFEEAGGEALLLVPSLNAEAAWIGAMRKILVDYQPNK